MMEYFGFNYLAYVYIKFILPKFKIQELNYSKKSMKMEQQQLELQAPHTVFLPFPAQGRVKPMLKLAELLSYASSQVTFTNTEYVHDHLLYIYVILKKTLKTRYDC